MTFLGIFLLLSNNKDGGGRIIKVVLQDGAKDCGVCCLLSIIRYYGGEVSKEYLRELTGTTKTGVSLYQLEEASKVLGFSCEGVKGDFSYLDLTRLPCIAHIIYQKKYQHFVVIYQVNEDKKLITLMDPAKGKVVLSYSSFRLLSSGYYLYLAPVKTLPIYSEKNILLAFIRRFCKQNRLPLLLVILFSLFSVFFQIIISFHFQYLYNYSIQYSLQSSIFLVSFFLVLFYVNDWMFQFLKNFILIKLSKIFDEELILYIYKQILLLPYLFFKNRTLGEILERMKDVIQVKNFFLRLFITLVTDVLFVFIFSYLLFRIHFSFLLLFLGYFFLSFVYGLLLFQKKKKKQKKVILKSDFIQSFLVEAFQNVDTVKGLHLEYSFLEQLEKKYQLYLKKSYELERVLLIEDGVRKFLSSCLFLFFYGVGSYLLIQGSLNIATFFICQHIFQFLIGSSERVLSFIWESYQIPISVGRIHDLFSLFGENFDGGTYYQLMKLEGDICFCNLSFSYSSRLLFSNFSLVIPRQAKVLLTGESGSGKSSLAKILMRYLEVPYGMVQIGHFDINHIHLELLRSRISYVTGSELLFSNTLFYNITVNREVSMEQVQEVSHLVLLDTLLDRLPLGYQSMVEENGFNFSGGERQKILLARALLKSSDIYIFDEAFHQIDVEQEKEILKNIFSYLKNKTVIVISHRLQNLDFYDVKYRLEKGKIYEI